MKYKSLFISDVHLGLPHTKLWKLLNFIRDNEFENIFLVGDIIDGWKLRRKFEWPEEANTFIQKIFRLSRKGINIVYLIGNHDEFLYSFENQSFGEISIKEKYIHTTLKGERVMLIHGHQFDGIIKYNKWLQWIGSVLYEWLIELNVKFNLIRHKFGLGYWSLSKFLKSKTKEVVGYVNSFEDTLIDYGKNHKVDSILCGHIHTPTLKLGEVNYYNTGDFVENSTCFVETLEGDMQLIEI